MYLGYGKHKHEFENYTYGNDVHRIIRNIIHNSITNDDVVFLCIGTDRSTGDSLGPLVGTYLKAIGYENVMGSLDEPIHFGNLDENVSKLPNDKFVIAIDSSLGRLEHIGRIYVSAGGLKPGGGVGKIAKEVGDFAIKGVVNVGSLIDMLNFQVLQNTRLAFVIKLATKIVNGIVRAFPILGRDIDDVKEEEFVYRL